MVHTGAARSGVDNLTKTLAVEWSADGIRINSVAPGTVNGSGLLTYPKEFRESVVKEHSKNNYAYRFASEQEIVAPLLFLLSDGASYITGATLRVDAGQSLYAAGHPPQEHNNLPPFDE